MTTIRFNAIAYSKKLREAGVNQVLADIQAEELTNIINNDLATKSDIQTMRNDLKNELLNLEYRLTIKLGSIAIACTVILGLILKLT